MQFLIIGKDGKDDKAVARRLKAREQHLKLGDEMEASGERWYGCVMLDDNGKMIGSMAVSDFVKLLLKKGILVNQGESGGKVPK